MHQIKKDKKADPLGLLFFSYLFHKIKNNRKIGNNMSKIKKSLKEWCKENEKEYLLMDWDDEKNEIFSATSFHLNKRYFWKCHKCGCEWKSTINRMIGNTKRISLCPNCKQETSLPEKTIAFFMDKYFAIETNLKPSWLYGMELDILLKDVNYIKDNVIYKDVAIEYDGALWHSEKATHQRDMIKNKLCKQNGIYLIRIREEDCPPVSQCQTIIIQRKSEEQLEIAIRDILLQLNIYMPSVNISDNRSLIKEYWYHNND
jgi:hypothetical protein